MQPFCVENGSTALTFVNNRSPWFASARNDLGNGRIVHPVADLRYVAYFSTRPNLKHESVNVFGSHELHLETQSKKPERKLG